MSDPTDSPPQDDQAEASRLERIVDKVVTTNSEIARRHINRFGGGKTGPELLQRLDRQYRVALTSSGAAVGAAAAAPGVGTSVALALSGGEGVAALQTTMVYVLSYAEATGVRIEDLERRRTLLFGVLLGNGGLQTIEKVAGRVGKHWGVKVAQGVPLETIKQINLVLGRNFVTRYGTRQGIIVLGRAAPFGIGMGIGTMMGAVNAAIVIKSTRRAFSPVS